MACAELEALRLALMNITGQTDDSVRRHAEAELGDDLDGDTPVAALASATSFDEAQRHLDAALVDLESQIADASTDDDQYDYLRGRLVAVRDAERSLRRLRTQTDALCSDLGDTHHTLHEAFPTDR